MLKRLDTLEIATTDLADASSIYSKNFSFAVTKSGDGKSAIVKVGGAEIKLSAGDSVKAAIEAGGEGMIGLWLEAEDVEQVASKLKGAGLEPGVIREESGRRVLAIDPKLANQVPLFIFDRKGTV
jgi:predicted enzyme related to lactoylglutathione lyase